MGKVINYFGALILKDGKLVYGEIWVRNGMFIDPAVVNYIADVSIECFDTIIAPSFIDLKCNGAYGVDFQTNVDLKEGLARVCNDLPKSGVTNFCPSLITKDASFYQATLPLIRRRPAHPSTGAGVLGAHLDGPFISVIGAHPQEFVKSKGISNGIHDILDVYGQDLEDVAILALAPEVPGIIDIISELKRWGIKISIAHSKADINTGVAAVTAGASMISHLFNAMPNYHHRDPSIIGLVASDKVQDIKYTLICDGHHLHPAAVRMAYRMAAQGMCLITDGQAPMGLGLGEFKVGATDVEVVDRDHKAKPVCVLKGCDRLFGSVCLMNDAIRNLVEMSDCSPAFALECATKHPAEVMGIYPKKGSLNVGADADFVILAKDSFEVLATFIAGVKVYQSGKQKALHGFPISSHVNDALSPMAKTPAKRRKSETSTTPVC